jgi:hypothetical protein
VKPVRLNQQILDVVVAVVVDLLDQVVLEVLAK